MLFRSVADSFCNKVKNIKTVFQSSLLSSEITPYSIKENSGMYYSREEKEFYFELIGTPMDETSLYQKTTLLFRFKLDEMTKDEKYSIKITTGGYTLSADETENILDVVEASIYLSLKEEEAEYEM